MNTDLNNVYSRLMRRDSDHEKTLVKNFPDNKVLEDYSICPTPTKKLNFGNSISHCTSSLANQDDSTMIATNIKTFPEISTPEKIPRPLITLCNGGEITPPLKKTKRRDCTPIDSPPDNSVTGCLGYNQNSIKADTILMNAYSILKVNNTMKVNSDDNTVYGNTAQEKHFQKLSNSKFMEKIDRADSTINAIDDHISTKDIIDALRGSYLLKKIETGFEFIPSLFKTIMEDSALFNKITNLLCYCFFEGFNNRSNIFFKFLTRESYMEIVDHPLVGFEDNLKMMTDHIQRLDPDYTRYQIDEYPEDSRYVFSVCGQAILTTTSRDVVNCIISLRIMIVNDLSLIKNDECGLEEILTVDFIKIKIN